MAGRMALLAGVALTVAAVVYSSTGLCVHWWQLPQGAAAQAEEGKCYLQAAAGHQHVPAMGACEVQAPEPLAPPMSAAWQEWGLPLSEDVALWLLPLYLRPPPRLA